MKTKPMTMNQVARLAYDAGWRNWDLIRAVAVCWAESRGDAYALGINDHDPSSASYLSVDAGLWQINSYWHPMSSRDYFVQTLTPELNAALAYQIYTLAGWNAWNTYKAGAHNVWMHEARVAVNTELGLNI